jgi:hypothetical protein
MPASEGTVGAKPALAPAAGVDQKSAPYRYWWLVVIVLSLGAWGLVISAASLLAAIL